MQGCTPAYGTPNLHEINPHSREHPASDKRRLINRQAIYGDVIYEVNPYAEQVFILGEFASHSSESSVSLFENNCTGDLEDKVQLRAEHHVPRPCGEY